MDTETPEKPSRRVFLGQVATATATAVTASMVEGCASKHLKDLPPEEVKRRLAQLEDEYSKKYSKKVTVANTAPMNGVYFAYALDISRCVGCRRCVYSCVTENNQSRDPQVHWIRVLEMEKRKGIDFAHSDVGYDTDKVPREGHFYLPVACQQCDNAPCTKACPIKATWKEPDGIVVIDYDWCIGCRYCMMACPYGARHFNWGHVTLPPNEMNPDTHYLGNRPRPEGVVEKCSFCIQRTRVGRYPACVEVCPVGSRKFGNLLDPQSEIRWIIENKRVLVLKEELNTMPKFFYYYGS